MGKKKIIIIVVSIALVLAGAAIVFLMLSKKGSYRLLKIYEVLGEASVTREAIGEIEPYNNMVLESGDRIKLTQGKMTLQADDDKYIYLENGTELLLKAEGSSENSKTSIELLSGAITNDIQKKLSNDSTYEINTPNSTMSVRGTLFRVYIYVIDGVKYTRVSVFDGQVATRLVYKDGTVSDKEVLIEKGKEVIIYEDDKTTDYLFDPRDIDYSDLPEDVIRLLIDIVDDGRQLIPTKEELEALLEKQAVVTFVYKGKTFGTQVVQKGDKATVPTLSPAATGSWDWDFSKQVDKDITIEWK